MLFFDDERRNQIDLTKIGVLMTLIDEGVGVTQAVIDRGLEEFAARAARQWCLGDWHLRSVNFVKWPECLQ